MKRILISLSIIAAVAAIVVGGTIAFFSDTETSINNSFGAGTLNLNLTDANDDDTESETQTWELANVAPGASGGATLTVRNTGSIAGFLDLSSVVVTNAENFDAATNEAEVADDIDTSNASGGGEMGANLLVTVFFDANNNTALDGGETSIYVGNLNGFATIGLYDLNYSLPAVGTTYIRINWSLPTSTNNAVQGDSTTESFVVELDQVVD